MNILGDYKAGEITIDEDYVIQYGKGECYGDLMDEGINVITDKVYDEDIPKIKYAVEQLESCEISSVAVRVEGDDRYEWMLAVISYSEYENKGKKLIDVSLYNIIQDNDDEMRFYHTLVDEDPGTGLLNKRAITEYVKKLIDEDKVDYNVTVAIIDIDDFKSINDTYGHSFGDEVLLKVAGIVKDAIKEKGVAGRIGGDEMFIVLLGMENEDQIRSVLRSIRDNIEMAYHDREGVVTTCSIGSATYPADASNYTDIFNIADKLLYLAKEKGKNRYIIYEDDVHRQYVKETGEAAIRVKDVLKYNKRSIVLDVLGKFLLDSDFTFYDICESIAPCFEFDDIGIYMGPDWKRIKSWGKNIDCTLDIPYINNPEYIANFDKYNIFAVDGPIQVRERCEQLYQVIVEQNINSSIHYLIGTKENPAGLITYNKSKPSKKWSSWDIDWMCIISRMIELKVFGK